MSESAPTTGNREQPSEEQTNNSWETPSQTGGETVSGLQLTIVEYDDSADRGTIHPPDLAGIERMETWMSVDLSVVTDLSMWR